MKTRIIEKHYDEFAVKNAYPLVRSCRALKHRFPHKEMDKSKFPDRGWFWGICFTAIPKWAEMYYEKVMKYRLELYAVKHRDKKKIIDVSPRWMIQLEAHDFNHKRFYKQIKILTNFIFTEKSSSLKEHTNIFNFG